jgi:hypothetical protein
MVVALHDREADRLARGLHGRREVAALALEFGRLIGAVDERDGRHQLVEMTLRAELFLDLVGELDIARTRREPYRFEIVLPLPETPPLITFAGRPKSFCQSVVSSTPAKWPPEE